MSLVLAILAVIILVTLLRIAALPGSYEVRTTGLIKSSPELIFDKVKDLKSWQEWSPWLMHEPDCPLSFSENPTELGSSYSWDGKVVGAGKMEHQVLQRPSHMEQKLTFTRPFKSECKVAFDFSAADGGTEVTWIMQGSMPFLMRPLIRRVKEMIGLDYELGLALLGGVLNPDSEHPQIEFVGEQQRDATTYISIPWQGTLADMPAAMQKGFKELVQYSQSEGPAAIGQPFTVTHKARKRATYFVIDMAIPVADDTTDVKYAVKILKGGKFHQTQLKGAYRFLKLAWHSAINQVKMKKMKMDWNRPCVELYENDSTSVESTNEIVTSIFIPIK